MTGMRAMLLVEVFFYVFKHCLAHFISLVKYLRRREGGAEGQREKGGGAEG